jgi:hypothetical protein
MIRYVGPLLIATAIAHAVTGMFLFGDALASIGCDGFVNAVDPHLDRQLAFWFMLFTPVLFTMGLLMRHAIATDDAKLQSMLGWSMLGIGAFGAIAMPVSGFWAAIVLSIPVLVGRRGGYAQRGQHGAAGA